MKRLITSLAMFAILAVAQHLSAAVVTETFDVGPGWVSLGSGSNGNDFGYQPGTSHAGGSAGEAGGHFTRSTFIRYYGDSDIGGILSLNEPFSASGRFDHTARNTPDFGTPLIIGHFSTSGLAKIGIDFTDNGTQNLHWGLRVIFDDGRLDFNDGGSIAGPYPPIAPNVDRTWSYSWDPTAGANGVGQLFAAVDGLTTSIDFTPEQRARGITLNAFGFSGVPAGDGRDRPNYYADMFIDDVTYTVVPEPSTVVLAALGLLGLAVFGRRRR